MKSLTFLVVFAATAVAGLVAPEPGWAQPDCNHIWFAFDPELPDCPGDPLSEGDAIEVTTSAYTVSIQGCYSTFTKVYDSTRVFRDGCSDTSSDRTCTIFATGTLSGKYEILEVNGGCYRVCNLCP